MIPRPVGEVLRDPVDEASVHRIWQRVSARAEVRAKPRPTPWLRLAVAASVVLALAAVGTVLARRRGTVREQHAPFAGLTVGPRGAPETARLADGSWIRAEAGTAIEPRAETGRLFEAGLLHGRVEVGVVHRDGHRFRIDCGTALVEVVGTRFRVEREGGQVRVRVHRGRVQVFDRLADRTVALESGDVLQVGPARAAPATPRAPSADGSGPAPPPTPRAAGRHTGRNAVERPPAAAADWIRLMDDGQLVQAAALVDEIGWEDAARRATAAELLALADLARQTHRPDRAVRPLQHLLARYPQDPQAPIASYTLGVVAMDRLGDPARAASALEDARARGLPPSLEEHALGRIAIARGRAGDREAARRAAREYLERYPGGSMAEAVRPWAGLPR